MIVILALLLHAVVLGGPAARMLERASWATRFPRTALRLWHTCAAGLLLSLTVALVLTAHDVWEHAMVWLFHADKPLIHAAYGGAWQAEGVAESALLLLLTGAGALCLSALRRSARARRERERHRLTADAQAVCAEPGDPAVRVLDHPTPLAFCIPGARRGPRIVVTTAAQRLLSARQFAAVLAHERAHLRMRHHRMTLAADVVSDALGWAGLLRSYSRQVRRLSEMAADDEAAGHHGGRAVASALLEMAAAPGDTNAGAPALPALTGSDAGERIRRLITAMPVSGRRLTSALALSAAAAVLALPPALSVAPAVVLADTAHATHPHEHHP